MEENQQGPSTPKRPYMPPRGVLNSSRPSATPAKHLDRTQDHYKQLNPEFQSVIYGTNINIPTTMHQIREFLFTFEVSQQQDDEIIRQKKYLIKLRQFDNYDFTTQISNNFDIDACHIREYSAQMYVQLIYFPAEMISLFDRVLHDLYLKEFIEPQTNEATLSIRKDRIWEIKVGIINLNQKDKICVKDLAPVCMGRMMGLTGIVVRVSDIYPQMIQAHFCCLNCFKEKQVKLQSARIQEPKICQKCKRKDTLQLIHNKCKFVNKQYIKLQQLLQNTAQGQSPSSITLLAFECNADKMRAGDFVEVTGIYRCNPIKLKRGQNSCRSIFDTYFDVISLEMLEAKNKRIKINKVDFTQEQRHQIFQMGKRPHIIQHLVNSFSPSIYGHNEVKKGILTQLFGGSRKVRINGGNHRAEINVCLLGDPSTAKSQMLQQVHRIAPRSVYTCGRGSSSVGLTANVRKDPQTRQFMLESGALVLSDEGICCIDEFDKMDRHIHTVLLEVMQQQTISIAKAGIVCQLNSRTAILAAANPINSKYDIKKSVVQNINMPPSLLSRFDLIYIMLDVANEIEDRRIATHILDIYTKKHAEEPKVKKTQVFGLQQLADYISFAKGLKPILTEKAGKRLQEEYLRLRSEGQGFNTISVTPRLLQSLIRISEAFAKMRLSNEVSVQDAQQAIYLINFATLKSATDPDTGIVDMDMIATGRSTNMKKKIQQFSKKIKSFIMANESKYCKGTQIQHLQEDFKSMNKTIQMEISRQDFIEALRMLDSQSVIYLFKNHRNRMMFKLKQFNET